MQEVCAELLETAPHTPQAVRPSSLSLQRDPVLLEARKQTFASRLISGQTDRLVTSCFTSDANTGLTARKHGTILASAVTSWEGAALLNPVQKRHQTT